MEKWTERLDKLTEEELLAEAEKIEDELGLSHEIDEEPDDIFYLYEEIKKENRLKDLRLKELEEREKERQKKAFNRKRVAKRMVQAGFMVACVVALAVTSTAGLKKISWKARYVLSGGEGNWKYTVDDGKIEMEGMEYQEKIEKMKRDIKETLGAEVPEFWYKPDDFRLENYKIHEHSHMGIIWYKCHNQYFIIQICKNPNAMVFSSGTDGIVEDVGFVDNDGTQIKISIYKDEKNNQIYIAEWSFEDTSYVIKCRLEKEELIKILRNMHY